MLITINTRPGMVNAAATMLDAPRPVRVINTQQSVNYINTSAVCRIEIPVVPPSPIYTEPSITLVAANTLLAGMPIYITNVGNIDKADASAIPAIGVEQNDAYAGAPAAYISEGSVSRQDWTAITGRPDLVPGSFYYLASVGKLSNTPPVSGPPVSGPPVSGLLQQIGIAVSRSTLDVNIKPVVQLA